MSVIILSSSPNTDGLTQACVDAVQTGLAGAGLAVRSVRLTDARVGLCRQCDDGWGTCRDQHECQLHDGFQEVHRQCLDADALVLVSPVYWGEASESMKAFVDRLRRCEATREESPLNGKNVLVIAAAGGGGGGLVSCLDQLERFTRHVRARRFDMIGVTRWTREAKLPAIEASAAALGAELCAASGDRSVGR